MMCYIRVFQIIWRILFFEVCCNFIQRYMYYLMINTFLYWYCIHNGLEILDLEETVVLVQTGGSGAK